MVIWKEIITLKQIVSGIDRDSRQNENTVSNHLYTSEILEYFNYRFENNDFSVKYCEGNEDDDDCENIQINNSFDLALRKFITKINDTEIVNSREPVIIKASVDRLNRVKTAGYYHEKEALNVKTGDIITYKLRIYNEGGVVGYVRNITDYLPEGLEFLEDENNDIWMVDNNKSQEGITAISRKSGVGEIEIPASYGSIGYKKLADGTLQDEELFWKDLEIKCRVTSTTKDTLLINVAELTNYGYKLGNSFVSANSNNVDRDSIKENVFNDKDVDNLIDDYYKDRDINDPYKSFSINGVSTKLVPGREDDDDFESIKVDNPIIGNYGLDLKKTDEKGNVLQGVFFNVKEGVIGETETTSKNVSTESDGIAIIEVDKEINTSNVSKIDTYEITEMNATEGRIVVNGKNYKALKNAITIYVKKENIDNKYVLSDVSFNEDFSSSFKQKNNEQISIDIELYNGDTAKVYATIENNTAKITIQNKEEKRYKIKMIKHDMDGNAISNSTLYISTVNHPQVTDNTGTIETTQVVEELNSDEYIIYCAEYATPGYENLFKNVNIKIKYKIDENGKIQLIPQKYTTTESTRDYVLVKKDYYSTQITGADDEFNYYFTDNVKVTVNNDGEIPELIVTLKNPKLDNTYGIQILKQDEEGNGIKGVNFKVKEGSEEKTVTTGDDGKVIIEDNKEMTSTDTDTYEITEIDVGDNKIIKLKEDEVITVSVEKEYKNSKYNVKKVYVNGQEEYNVKLANGETETVKTEIIDERLVQITIPNKHIEGKYSLRIKKIDDKTKEALSGVTFKVLRQPPSYNYEVTTDTTNNEGITNVFEDKDIVDCDTEHYTIKEINLGNNKYIKLKSELSLQIKKEIQDYKYKVSEVSFGNSGQTKTVKLQDESEVEVKAEIVEENIVQVTIPNKPIEGSYSLKLKKIDSETNNPISGVKFKIKNIDVRRN